MPHPAPPAPRSEAELLERAAALAGRSLGQIAAQFGVVIPVERRRMKGWTGQVMDWCLGADAASRPQPDFRKIGVE
ncbi:MAG: DNA mismatch repair endonuclease MutH, partial [Gammaproteobacteria bacterium]